MKKTKLILLLAGIVLLSGWIAFFIQYVGYTKKIALLQTRIEQLDSQVKAIAGISKSFDQTIAEIDRMISEFEKLKETLGQMRDRIEKATKTE